MLLTASIMLLASSHHPCGPHISTALTLAQLSTALSSTASCSSLFEPDLAHDTLTALCDSVSGEEY